MRREEGMRRVEARGSAKKPVYVSGPAYSGVEKVSMAELARAVEDAGYMTYLPCRDGLEQRHLELMVDRNAQAEAVRHAVEVVRRAVFALNVYQVVDRCGCLVLGMNGRVPDEGSVFTAALAFTSGRPVVLYKRDLRAELYGHDNAMITGLSMDFRTVNSRDGIPAALAITDRRIRPSGGTGTSAGIPPLVREAVEVGRAIWPVIEGCRPPAVGCGEWPAFIERLARECAGLNGPCWQGGLSGA